MTSGHRLVPHTADVGIEAWASSREECVAEAITAMVESFARVPANAPVSEVEFDIPAGSDDQMLVSTLDEVLFRLDTSGQIPAGAGVDATDGGLKVRLRVVDSEQAELIGAVPKAVSLHELRFAAGVDGWSCHAILDV